MKLNKSVIGITVITAGAAIPISIILGFATGIVCAEKIMEEEANTVRSRLKKTDYTRSNT